MSICIYFAPYLNSEPHQSTQTNVLSSQYLLLFLEVRSLSALLLTVSVDLTLPRLSPGTTHKHKELSFKTSDIMLEICCLSVAVTSRC